MRPPTRWRCSPSGSSITPQAPVWTDVGSEVPPWLVRPGDDQVWSRDRGSTAAPEEATSGSSLERNARHADDLPERPRPRRRRTVLSAMRFVDRPWGHPGGGGGARRRRWRRRPDDGSRAPGTASAACGRRVAPTGRSAEYRSHVDRLGAVWTRRPVAGHSPQSHGEGARAPDRQVLVGVRCPRLPVVRGRCRGPGHVHLQPVDPVGLRSGAELSVHLGSSDA